MKRFVAFLGIVLVLFLFSPVVNAGVTLLTPANSSKLDKAPYFSWKVGTPPVTDCSGQHQTCGTYTFDCKPPTSCVCFYTTEGKGNCADDFYCSNPTCKTSADCGTGMKCYTDTCCGYNVCGSATCTDGSPDIALDGYTASGGLAPKTVEPVFDVFLFISYFNYGGQYYKYQFWMKDTGFQTPDSWWKMLASDVANYWAVVGYNTTTKEYDVSDVWTFIKAGTPPVGDCSGQHQICGTYTFDCKPPTSCVCFYTTEGKGNCADDFYCSNPECRTSADCGTGMKCYTETCCGYNVCGPATCTDGSPGVANEEGGISAAGR